jgi:hypothetical protein
MLALVHIFAAKKPHFLIHLKASAANLVYARHFQLLLVYMRAQLL